MVMTGKSMGQSRGRDRWARSLVMVFKGLFLRGLKATLALYIPTPKASCFWG